MNPEKNVSVAALPIMAGLVVVVFLLDLVAPLGYAPWVLYMLPVGASLLHRNPLVPLAVAAVASVASSPLTTANASSACCTKPSARARSYRRSRKNCA